MRVHAVQPTEAEQWIPRLEWHFDSFCRDGSLNPSGLWADIEAEQRQLWVVLEKNEVLAAVLTLVTEDNFKTCDVTHGAGKERDKWEHLILAISHWAKEIGCKRMRVLARPGWERIFKPFFSKTHVILERAL